MFEHLKGHGGLQRTAYNAQAENGAPEPSSEWRKGSSAVPGHSPLGEASTIPSLPEKQGVRGKSRVLDMSPALNITKKVGKPPRPPL